MRNYQHKAIQGNSLMAQWLRICFAVQVTWVQTLGQGTKIPHTMGQLSFCVTTKNPCATTKLTQPNKWLCFILINFT